MSVTVTQVIQDVRNLLQFSNQANMSNDIILYYMNMFWQITMPQLFTNNDFKSTATFVTQKGVSSYQIPVALQQNVVDGFLCDAVPMTLFQNPMQFQTMAQINRPNYPFLVGNGNMGVYEGQFPSFPLIPGFTDQLGNLMSNFFVTSTISSTEQLVLQDDGLGNLTGDGSGTIDYATGYVSNVLFSKAIPSGTSIWGNGIYWSQGRPMWALFNQNIITLRPVPDKAYCIQYNYFCIPTTLTIDGTLPMSRYQEILSRGTAYKIAQVFKDEAQVPTLKEQLNESIRGLLRLSSRYYNNQRPSNQFYLPTTLSVNPAWANNPAPQS